MSKERLRKLISAAKKGNWEHVDSELSKPIPEKYVGWAYIEGIEDKDDNVRDLAGSILEKATIPASSFSAIRPVIFDTIKKETLRAKSPYAKYRLAFSMAAHSPGEYKTEVMSILEEAARDRDVSQIAEGYIKRLKNSKA